QLRACAQPRVRARGGQYFDVPASDGCEWCWSGVITFRRLTDELRCHLQRGLTQRALGGEVWLVGFGCDAKLDMRLVDHDTSAAVLTLVISTAKCEQSKMKTTRRVHFNHIRGQITLRVIWRIIWRVNHVYVSILSVTRRLVL